ncbi:class I adenylate-forming enzyme family protein [Bacillus thermotolerans]|uniref:class I adenylate-forming enzyme family protein n=1 Tax=Bacillus thermotolerans TaxID=1221996 RepID=UPI000582C4EC|nr:AMP-binding protein [Bacillus thermotolerans]KKB35203.1 Acetoacetyl-CoA synthetase [Bacillus thermotolerans]
MKMAKQTNDPRTVKDLLEAAVRIHPEKEVICDGRRRLTYQELFKEAALLGRGLQKLGIQKEDRVAVCLPNWHECIVALFAISRIGAILVPLNTSYRTEEIEYILRNSGAKAAFLAKEFQGIDHLQQFTEVQKRLCSLTSLIAVRFEASGLESYRKLLNEEEIFEADGPSLSASEDLAVILYTSGTTGKPKGVMLTHQNLVSIAQAAAKKMQCTERDVFLIPVPLFHVMGMMFVLRTVVSCARLVLMETFKAEQALSLIQEEKVTVHPGVPTMFILELNHPAFSSFDLSSLRTGEMAAAPCPVEVVRRIRSEMGCDILVAYGLTETSANVTMTDFADKDEIRAETVGRALPGVELKTVDSSRKETAVGEVGELACRSIGLAKGYYQMPEQTAEAFDQDGWFYTGDMAAIDEEGYVRIVGRKKEMIIRGGYNIYPREIEEVFYTHPSVLEAAVIGLPDTVLGEISCAVIRLREGRERSEDELKDFAGRHLAYYKVPDKIFFKKDLPMTASGKIIKTALKKEMEQVLSAELR